MNFNLRYTPRLFDMPIKVAYGSLQVVRKSISLSSFPTLRRLHMKSEEKRPAELHTPAVERLGRQYVQRGFKNPDTKEFMRRVCRWGKRAGIAEKVVHSNSLTHVSAQLRLGHENIMAGNYASAIKAITDVKGLGVSFGSKHLRMMAPTQAVVLDSVISEQLGYPRTPEGYLEFLGDCKVIKETLEHKGIYPFPNRATWRLSEVEMAIFMSLRED